MKKLFILFILILTSISFSAKAYDFFAINNDGDTIYYNITSTSYPYTVKVTFKGASMLDYIEYKDTINIPSNVTHDDTIYSVTVIDDGAFFACNNLISVIIPNSVNSIGYNAFHSCLGLTSVIIPNSVDSIGNGAFNNCTGLISIIIGDSVTSIGNGAFWHCTSLTSVIIPNSVIIIRNAAFSSCTSLASVIIGNSVTSVENGAFLGCSSLTSIACLANIPPIIQDGSVFRGITDTIPVYVPCESLSLYQSSQYWNNFTNLHGISDTTINASICQGEIYSLNGFNADTTGVYINTIQNINNCDSIITLNLIVNQLSTPNNFTLNNIANYIELNWQGKGENYVVYRDNDSITTITDTVYQDINVVNGINYCYKVKAFTSDCESEFSEEICKVFIGLSNIINNELSATIYPNPTKDKAILEIEGLTKEADVILYDLFGKTIKTYKLNADQGKLEIDVSDVAKGIYNIKVVNNNYSITRKLIVR